MSPTFVEDDKGVLVIGAPGGSRIISMVLFGILDYVNQPEVDLPRMVAAPRYHHQCWPDQVEIEPDGFFRRVARGARRPKATGCRPRSANGAICRWRSSPATTGAAQAASDPRGFDMGGY